MVAEGRREVTSVKRERRKLSWVDLQAARPITDLNIGERDEVLRVEAELDDFVVKRAEKAETKGDEAREIAWQESVKKYHDKRRRANAEMWHRYHDDQIRSHEASLGVLITYHKRERARYARVLGLPELNGSED